MLESLNLANNKHLNKEKWGELVFSVLNWTGSTLKELNISNCDLRGGLGGGEVGGSILRQIANAFRKYLTIEDLKSEEN